MMNGITVLSPVGINQVEAQPIAPRAMYKAENWPHWVDVDDDGALCPIVGKPEDIHIVVTGGPGKHSAFVPTFGTSKSVTRKIETPR